MANILNIPVLGDLTVYICIVSIFAVLLLYLKTKDKELIYFLISAVFYLSGEICYDVCSTRIGLPVDFIFYFCYYFVIFLFFKQRTKSLLKNPALRENVGMRNAILVILDFFIIAIITYVIFYYFDRVSVASHFWAASVNAKMLINFIYPVFDFLLLGYYVYISKVYILYERRVYLPTSAFFLFWAASDFLFSYEAIFQVKTYGIGNFLQFVGLILLIVFVIIFKRFKSESYYTTLDLNRDATKIGDFNWMINSLMILYLVIYLFCLTRYTYSSTLMRVAGDAGVLLLCIALLRQNIINYFMQLRLNIISKDESTDPLTGLYSRKYAFSLMQSLYKSAVYFKMNISALMLDIDHFKIFNDTFGHISGDHVLQDIAQIITDSIDASDIACRYGGEEFLVILPGADESEGMEIAEKIRENIETHVFDEVRFHKVKITVSIGGATAGGNIKDAIDLVTLADSALYQAKEERNKSAWSPVA